MSKATADRWEYLCILRNQVAHDRNQEIAYLMMREQVEELIEGTASEVESLLY